MARARPYTPQQLEAIANQLGSVYAQGETAILRVLARGSITEWKRAFLQQQVQQIRETLDALGAATIQWTQLHIPGLYTAGMAFADERLPGGMDLGMTALHTQALEVLSENVVNRFGEARNVVGRHVDDVFRQVSLQSIQQGLVGGETRLETSKRVVQGLQERGITAFVDAKGREWGLGDYAQMVARTTTREATMTGTANRVLEAGYDLVEVSSHGGSCETCADWEGEVLSLTGNTEGYPTLADAEAEGLFHPNCVHVLLPVVDQEERNGNASAEGE